MDNVYTSREIRDEKMHWQDWSSSSNVLSILTNSARSIARPKSDGSKSASIEVLAPGGEVVYAIKAGSTKPHIDLTANYPAKLERPL
jgi:hypothetical protein